MEIEVYLFVHKELISIIIRNSEVRIHLYLSLLEPKMAGGCKIFRPGRFFLQQQTGMRQKSKIGTPCYSENAIQMKIPLPVSYLWLKTQP